MTRDHRKQVEPIREFIATNREWFHADIECSFICAANFLLLVAVVLIFDE